MRRILTIMMLALSCTAYAQTTVSNSDAKKIQQIKKLLQQQRGEDVDASTAATEPAPSKRNESQRSNTQSSNTQRPRNAKLAPDFTLKDINGQSLSLSSLRGKYVVLDFWGSWCGWCIQGMPKMKKYYTKYSGKFEILGIDCQDSQSAWKNAVKKHALPWLHVYNPNSSRVLSNYNISGFPTKIVVDPDGYMIKTVEGEDPAFYTYLDKLFQ